MPEAIELAKAEAFDLILMDNQLPNLGGVETTSQLRSGNWNINTDSAPSHSRCTTVGETTSWRLEPTM
ncbi:hypothetical protein O9993_06340 [Vibrio lentus]|nr:hypothetical protein [Vibrio lentus]